MRVVLGRYPRRNLAQSRGEDVEYSEFSVLAAEFLMPFRKLISFFTICEQFDSVITTLRLSMAAINIVKQSCGTPVPRSKSPDHLLATRRPVRTLAAPFLTTAPHSVILRRRWSHDQFLLAGSGGRGLGMRGLAGKSRYCLEKCRNAFENCF